MLNSEFQEALLSSVKDPTPLETAAKLCLKQKAGGGYVRETESDLQPSKADPTVEEFMYHPIVYFWIDAIGCYFQYQ